MNKEIKQKEYFFYMSIRHYNKLMSFLKKWGNSNDRALKLVSVSSIMKKC